MSLLTEQEIDVEANKTLIQLQGLTRHMWQSYGRAIEAKVIEKIKAQGPSAHLCSHIQSGDMVVTADDSQDIFDKHERALWFIEPLYHLPKGD